MRVRKFALIDHTVTPPSSKLSLSQFHNPCNLLAWSASITIITMFTNFRCNLEKWVLGFKRSKSVRFFPHKAMFCMIKKPFLFSCSIPFYFLSANLQTSALLFPKSLLSATAQVKNGSRKSGKLYEEHVIILDNWREC